MKVGDKVILTRMAYSNRTERIKIIDRETKLYWIVDGSQFKKSSLHSPSGSMGVSTWIREPEGEHELVLIERCEKARKLAQQLKNMNWNAYNLETLESIMNIISPEEK